MASGREFDKPAIYQIRVKGTLDRKWSDWFDGLTIILESDDETLLVGTVVDQSALYGLLLKLHNLGLPLLSVRRVPTEEGPPCGY
jgi:hypothetical protein